MWEPPWADPIRFPIHLSVVGAGVNRNGRVRDVSIGRVEGKGRGVYNAAFSIGIGDP